MTEAINPWGPLGKPSKEQIEEWCNWPHGQFTQYKKMLSRKPPRGKPLTEMTVYVTKSISSLYLAEVKVFAKDYNDAIRNLGYDYSKLNYAEEPYKTERVSYSYSSVKPYELVEKEKTNTK